MSFRPATKKDERELLRWRHADEIRGQEQGWYGSNLTRADTHKTWFKRNRKRILIWEEDGQPVGALRVDSNGEVALSGGARREMLLEARTTAGQYFGRLKACVDTGDQYTISALKAAGFVEYPVRFFVYRP